jgi:glycosyltransferase involved in cell wall biosynthesis
LTAIEWFPIPCWFTGGCSLEDVAGLCQNDSGAHQISFPDLRAKPVTVSPRAVPKKTIAYFDDSPQLSGTTRYILTLISEIDRDRYNPVFFAPRASPWHSRLRDAGVDVYTVLPALPEAGPPPVAAAPPSAAKAPPALGWWLGLAGELRLLRRLFQLRQVDLLHSNNAGTEPAPVAARLAGVPRVIATWHVDSTYDLDGIRSGFRYRTLEKACMRSLHHAIAVSRSTAADWIARCGLGESYWEKVTVVLNGVPADRLIRHESVDSAKAALGLTGRLIVGSVGRLEAAKGYEYLIRGLPELVRARPDVLLRILGRGELRIPLAELARSLGVESHIEFVDFVEDIHEFVESIDIYVQPSLCEAQGLAILEGGAVGAPIVASRVGGIPECVKDGEMGILVPTRNPAALTEALLRLANDPAARARMADESARVVRESFRSDQMIAKTMAVYEKMLSR